MDPYDSNLFARVKVTGRGLRAHERYIGSKYGGQRTGSRIRNVSATWAEVLPWAVLGLVVAALLFGAGWLALRIF